MSDQSWRTDVDAGDFFLHQKKRLEIADRRPVIRKGSDLVGPGIGSSAVRITDYNDLLVTFNGYYSSAVGALNAPDGRLPLGQREAFVGYVVSDAELGGRQVFTGLTTGTEYSRSFNRSPTDPETLGWTEWSGQRIPPTAQGFDVTWTEVPNGWTTVLAPPALRTIGESGIYERSEAGIKILKQGVYTGHIQVGDTAGDTVGTAIFYFPDGNQTISTTLLATPFAPVTHFPFTVWATDGAQAFSVMGQQTMDGNPRNLWWRFQCTRVGDAV